MKIAILGATGRTGRLLIDRALRGGHEVLALARTASALDDLAAPNLTVSHGDVFDADSVSAAFAGADALVSALGVARGGDATTLVAGADVVATLQMSKVVWLGSLGLGATKGAAGPLFTPVFNLALRREIPAKIQAENVVRGAGGTVVHAPILTEKPATGRYRLLPSASYRPPLMFPSISRADVAALMIEEVLRPRFTNETAVFATQS